MSKQLAEYRKVFFDNEIFGSCHSQKEIADSVLDRISDCAEIFFEGYTKGVKNILSINVETLEISHGIISRGTILSEDKYIVIYEDQGCSTLEDICPEQYWGDDNQDILRHCVERALCSEENASEYLELEEIDLLECFTDLGINYQEFARDIILDDPMAFFNETYLEEQTKTKVKDWFSEIEITERKKIEKESVKGIEENTNYDACAIFLEGDIHLVNCSLNNCSLRGEFEIKSISSECFISNTNFPGKLFKVDVYVDHYLEGSKYVETKEFDTENEANEFFYSEKNKGVIYSRKYSRRNQNNDLFFGDIIHCNRCGMSDCPQFGECNIIY